MIPAPPDKQCRVESCSSYTIYGSGYCQQHARVCTCGKRMSLHAARCKSCWASERKSDQHRAARCAAWQEIRTHESHLGQIKELLGIYIAMYKSGQDQAFAESRIRALANQL